VERRRRARASQLGFGRAATVGALAVAVALVVASTALLIAHMDKPERTATSVSRASPAAPSPPTAEASTAWSVVSDQAYPKTALAAVTCVDATDCWAVGSGTPYAVIEHFSGYQWGAYAIPGTPPLLNCPLATDACWSATLNAVTCVSATDCWAVGQTTVFTAGGVPASQQPLIADWSSSGWSFVPSPTIPATYPWNSVDPDAGLSAVSCIGAADCWAVGAVEPSGSLIEHWDGIAWSLIDVGPQGALTGLACTPAGDCWAVGAVTLHYADSTWTEVSIPTLTSIVCPGADDCWATQLNSVEPAHWDGTTWGYFASPLWGQGGGAAINAIACPAVTDCWAVGMEGFGTANSLLEHFDGSTWTEVSAPAAPNGVLRAIACADADECWAIGAYLGFDLAPLIETNVGADGSVTP